MKSYLRDGAFRKSVCSAKRAHWPTNRPLPAKSRTTTLGPFGEVIRSTGPMGKANPFRFSAKYQDDEADLLYYGYRYYRASTGTWISRDPIGEKGGMNVYDFVNNVPVMQVDPIGLLSIDQTSSGYDIGFWGTKLPVGPDGGTVSFSHPWWETDTSVPLLGGYTMSAKATVTISFPSLGEKNCKVSYTPIKVVPDFSFHLWPPPPSLEFTLSASAGDAAKQSVTIEQTIGFPYGTVSDKESYEGMSRSWTGCKCMQVKSSVEASASFKYDYVLVFAAAYALAYAPAAILEEPLPATVSAN